DMAGGDVRVLGARAAVVALGVAVVALLDAGPLVAVAAHVDLARARAWAAVAILAAEGAFLVALDDAIAPSDGGAARRAGAGRRGVAVAGLLVLAARVLDPVTAHVDLAAGIALRRYRRRAVAVDAVVHAVVALLAGRLVDLAVAA